MRTPLVGPLPVRGPWTAVGLSRGQFLAILAVAIAAFVLIGGPVWRDVHGDHFARIALSYAVIVPLVGLALRRQRPFPVGQAVAAIATIALVKLVATAVGLGLLALISR
jgi:hypothetical protein